MKVRGQESGSAGDLSKIGTRVLTRVSGNVSEGCHICVELLTEGTYSTLILVFRQFVCTTFPYQVELTLT